MRNVIVLAIPVASTVSRPYRRLSIGAIAVFTPSAMNDLINVLARPDWPGAPDGRTVIFMIVLAFTIGMFIGFIYMWTHEALSYSRTFVGALAILPIIVAMLMAAMSGSLIVVFGLLAVFGVVRF